MESSVLWSAVSISLEDGFWLFGELEDKLSSMKNQLSRSFGKGTAKPWKPPGDKWTER